MTLTCVLREQNVLADALTNGDFVNFRKENRMEVDVGSLGFNILPEMVRVADSLYADVKRHKEMGKDEGSRSGNGMTKPSEGLRDPWCELGRGNRGWTVRCDWTGFLFRVLVNGHRSGRPRNAGSKHVVFAAH